MNWENLFSMRAWWTVGVGGCTAGALFVALIALLIPGVGYREMPEWLVSTSVIFFVALFAVAVFGGSPLRCPACGSRIKIGFDTCPRCGASADDSGDFDG